MSFADAWSVCEVSQASWLSPEPQRMPKRHQEPVLVFRELKPKFAATAEVQQSEKTVERARSVQCAV